MLRSRKIWLVLAIAALLAVSFAASVVAAKKSSEDRNRYVTHGLDYLHARQESDGGFDSPENTAMAVLGAVASGERMGNSAWRVDGKNPYKYLQSQDLVSASTGTQVNNAPVYYARLIMAYVAMDRATSIGTAGSKAVNLLDQLLGYQDTSETSSSVGAFAPSLPSLTAAVRTTSWAILAMHNAGVSSSDSQYLAAAKWLAAQQNTQDGGDGGFPDTEQGEESDALDTALAYQALTVSADSSAWDADAARDYLQAAQKTNGGFAATAGGKLDTQATSAAIQAILAMGEDPTSADWTVSTDNPITALRSLCQTSGAYKSSSNTRLRAVIMTGWALTALNRKPFTTYPKKYGSAHTAFKFRPKFRVVAPKNGATYKTHVVLIRATYTDFYPRGTGIKPSACRLYVDGKNRTGPADIGSYGLRLQLSNVANGAHTYKIVLYDRAGNSKVIEHKFTVAVPTPVPTSTSATNPTYNPATSYPDVYPTHASTSTPSSTSTATGTPYPYPSPSPTTSGGPVVTGSPIPSPSSSASAAGTGTQESAGSAAGFVGGTLLAMLPIGAVASYLLLQRREGILDTASQGKVLGGGGSAWERFKQTLAKSKDLTRPSSRE